MRRSEMIYWLIESNLAMSKASETQSFPVRDPLVKEASIHELPHQQQL